MGLYDGIKKNYSRKTNFKLNESSKGKKGKKKLNEMGNFAGRMDKLRAARGRADVHNNNVMNQKYKRAEELLNSLYEIQEDIPELREIANSVKLWQVKGAFNIKFSANGDLYVEKDRDTLYVRKDEIAMSTSTRAAYVVTMESLKNDSVDELNRFIMLATMMVDDYPRYITAVNQLIDDYDLKYPEIKESGSKAGAEKRKAGRRKKNLEWLKSQVDKKPMADLSDEDRKAITKSIDKSLSTYKECNKKKPSKTMIERAKSRKRNPIIESGRTYTKAKNK